MSKTNTTQILKKANYSFNSSQNAWNCGKKPVNEEEVLIFLIQYAKSENIKNAGEYAEKELIKAKTTPEITTRAFIRDHVIRNRNRRIAGKYLFEKWCKMVKIEIVGDLDDFMRKNSLIAARFYDEIAAGYDYCKKQARIAGRVMRSVFLGLELRDEEREEEDANNRRQKKEPLKPNMKTKYEALKRHQEFMTKIYLSDP